MQTMETFLTGLALTAFFALCSCWRTLPYDESEVAGPRRSGRGLGSF
jgi:hypothetical protein